MKYQSTFMDCDACGNEWAAVHPVVAEYLECPVCHHMTPAPYVEKPNKMHYRNGRAAKNGDKVVQLETTSGKVVAIGQLQNAVAGNDYCNGEIVITGYGPQGPAIIIGACMCDCVHVDDIAAILAEKELDKRPKGK